VAQAFLVAYRAGAHRASAAQIFLKSAFFTDDNLAVIQRVAHPPVRSKSPAVGQLYAVPR
jgi:hypothetical protein